jgi:hypothetical protein
MIDFNNLRFTLKNYNYDQDPIIWSVNGQINNYQVDTHGKIIFKQNTKDFEFIKCPVNPQQTSFKYIKINKRAMTIDEILRLIIYFYYVGNKFTPFKIENTLDIEDDSEGELKIIRGNIHSELYSWSSFLMKTINFKELIELNTHGYKTYQLILEE